MARVLDASEDAALGRFLAGLVVRVVMACVGVLFLVFATHYDHAAGPWVHRLPWVGPRRGLPDGVGSPGFSGCRPSWPGLRPRGGRGDVCGRRFYDLRLRRWSRYPSPRPSPSCWPHRHAGPGGRHPWIAEDAQAPALVSRCHRASANLLVAFVCLLIVRAVMWLGASRAGGDDHRGWWSPSRPWRCSTW
ncbi:MAG: hypothetical protein R3F43_19280 [bacterium]